MISQVFKGEVSSDAEADQDDILVSTSGMVDHALEIFPGTTVVGA